MVVAVTVTQPCSVFMCTSLKLLCRVFGCHFYPWGSTFTPSHCKHANTLSAHELRAFTHSQHTNGGCIDPLVVNHTSTNLLLKHRADMDGMEARYTFLIVPSRCRMCRNFMDRWPQKTLLHLVGHTVLLETVAIIYIHWLHLSEDPPQRSDNS